MVHETYDILLFYFHRSQSRDELENVFLINRVLKGYEKILCYVSF